MMEQPRVLRKRRSRARSLAALALVALGGLFAPLRAQTPAPSPPAHLDVLSADFNPAAGEGGGLQQTSCSSCGSYGGPCCGPRVPELGGAAACCYPGRYPCDCCDGCKPGLAGFFEGVYHCICCPDPCYEPRWKALPNNAFFVDQVRPVTQMKLGADFGWTLPFPDKAELFWAQENAKGPKAFPGAAPGTPGEKNVVYQDVYLYTEAAVDKFGLFVYMPYRHVSPDLYPAASGFGDMAIGTKSMLLDCELIQFTFQFRTWLPTGNFTKGIGTGHTSLEPSFITAIKITDADYLQGQIAYLFPLGGTQEFEGSLVTWGLAYNRLLWHCGKDLQLVGSLESTLWWITNGLYTDPVTGLGLRARELSPMWNLGGGLRFVMCNTIDFGVGYSQAVTDDKFIGKLLRAEFRWRF